jgi:hypothetical protein
MRRGRAAAQSEWRSVTATPQSPQAPQPLDRQHRLTHGRAGQSRGPRGTAAGSPDSACSGYSDGLETLQSYACIVSARSLDHDLDGRGHSGRALALPSRERGAGPCQRREAGMHCIGSAPFPYAISSAPVSAMCVSDAATAPSVRWEQSGDRGKHDCSVMNGAVPRSGRQTIATCPDGQRWQPRPLLLRALADRQSTSRRPRAGRLGRFEKLAGRPPNRRSGASSGEALLYG